MLKINPEIADDVSVLNSKNTHVIMNEVLTNTQLWAEDQEIEMLDRQLSDELKGLRKDYERAISHVKMEMDSLDPKLRKVEFLQNEKQKNAKDHIDFGFLG